MTSFRERVRADAHLAVLQTLAGIPDYTTNHELIAAALKRQAGITLTESEMQERLAWLEDQGLARLETAGPLVLVTLTDLGHKVARAREYWPGVSRPRPSEI